MKQTIKGEGLAALFGSQAAPTKDMATGKELRQEIHRLADLLNLYADMTPSNREKVLETARTILYTQDHI